MVDVLWGIDVGVGSLGFSVIELNDKGQPSRIVDGITQVFPASAGAAERRSHRSMRTQYHRSSKRLSDLKAWLLNSFNLSSEFNEPKATATQSNSRIRLRALGLRETLQPDDLARAILHIAKNRGQRLTRALNDSGTKNNDNDNAANDALTAQNSARVTQTRLESLGREFELSRPAHPSELLYQREKSGKSTRLRKDRPDTPVFTRKMIEAELKCLLAFQADSNNDLYGTILTEKCQREIAQLVFFENEPKRPKIGLCRYRVRDVSGEIEERLPVGSNLFQEKRIYEEINNLRLIDKLSGASVPLSLDQRDSLIEIAFSGEDITGGKVRKVLELSKGTIAPNTSLDISKRSKGRNSEGTIKGHQIAAAFAKGKALDLWQGFDAVTRSSLADLLRTQEDFEIVRDKLMMHGVNAEQAQEIANASISSARSAVGPTATRLILNALRSEVIPHNEAVAKAGLKDPTAETPHLDRLPYYGVVLPDACVGATNSPQDPLEEQYGRIPNPVVHQSLNRIRKTANAFIKLYGKPKRIHVELARDLNKSADERAEGERLADTNGKTNDQYIADQIENTSQPKRRLSRDDRLKFKLHRMQNGHCLYTGKTLSVENLFDGTTEVDHILPRSETLDDGISNLALVVKTANRDKGKRSPHDAFEHGYQGRDYASILEQAMERGPGVYWRFQPGAMDRFKNETEFRSRFLNDTRYIGKVACQYLSTVCKDPNGVIAVNGRLMDLLKRHWGLDGLIREIMTEAGTLAHLDPKSRNEEDPVAKLKRKREEQKKLRLDHRHHLLDAIVVGCTTRSDVQRISTLAASFDRQPRYDELKTMINDYLNLFPGAGLPWSPDFRSKVKAVLTNDPNRIAPTERPMSRVVHRADHNPLGALHAASNYAAMCRDPADPETFLVKQHKPLGALAYIQKIEEAVAKLDDTGRAEAILSAAVQAGTQRWWGGADPLASLKNLQRSLSDIKTEIQTRADAAPDEAGQKQAKRLKWAIEEIVKSGQCLRYTQVSAMKARILKPGITPNARPLQLAPTKTKNSNHCVDLFRDKTGDLNWMVKSRLDANRPGGLDPLKDTQVLMRLHTNDLVEMLTGPEPDAPRALYRLVSLSPGDLEFLPVQEARPVKDAPKGIGQRVKSLKRLKELKPAQVALDPSGRVRWRSSILN